MDRSLSCFPFFPDETPPLSTALCHPAGEAPLIESPGAPVAMCERPSLAMPVDVILREAGPLGDLPGRQPAVLLIGAMVMVSGAIVAAAALREQHPAPLAPALKGAR